jgi:hypothetical protein
MYPFLDGVRLTWGSPRQAIHHEAGRKSLALTHRCLPSLPRTRPNHSEHGRWSSTHQSRWPALDQVAISTGTGGSTARRSSSLYSSGSSSISN